ncbi:hypothetical protein H0A36_27000 [Endozoicomonas sp. SM1973]|uniref:N-acetyltransferase domain-containing protein n=1 Tax=Spartinivicinus marinus TaxID=2994442 RepID=A0A853IJV2_9GAMM|nr:hypothetical protein [Spartinivicinus marinus]MCX4025631.1 hypothetical protein [Spartinivicinus marinus]NYZ69667.1 hypothetical protein [Spartinivicinus marinus]
MIEIRETDKSDCYLLASRLRQQDLDELEALGSKPLDALLRGLNWGLECYTAWKNGKPIAMFGVAEQDGQAIPWLLGSAELENKGMALCKLGKKYINNWLNKYGYLTNAVSTKNTVAISWLEYLGATLGAFGVFGTNTFQIFSFSSSMSE